MKTTAKKSTIYFDPQIHKALRLKAAETDSSVSEIVNDAIRIVLAEDTDDIAAFAERAHEPNLSFEEVLKDLKRLLHQTPLHCARDLDRYTCFFCPFSLIRAFPISLIAGVLDNQGKLRSVFYS